MKLVCGGSTWLLSRDGSLLFQNRNRRDIVNTLLTKITTQTIVNNRALIKHHIQSLRDVYAKTTRLKCVIHG